MRAGLMAVVAGVGLFLGLESAVGGPPEPPAAAPAADAIGGDWDGILHVGGTQLRLALHVRPAAGGFEGTMDSIDQGVTGLKTSNITHTGDKVRFEVNPPGGVFEGRLAADGATITGTWRQGGGQLPLVLARRPAGTPQAALVRPQEPSPPFPYQADDVRFSSPKARGELAGTLTLPKGAGRHPAVVLISGSGPNNRDELVAGHRPFLVIADYLTRRGIAVLRYDKRGIGASKGNYAHATSKDFADDAAAAVAFLRSRGDIDPAHVGLIGHSEGGLIAPMVAARDPSIAFVVLMAAPGVDGETILKLQGAAIARAQGADEAAVAKSSALNDRIFSAVKSARDAAEATSKVEAIMAANPAAALGPNVTHTLTAAVASDWFRFFLTYDPVPALRQVRCPALVLAGSKDLQVPPDANLPPIRAALAGDRDVTVSELTGLNHLFQSAVTGSPVEYSRIDETVSPAVLAQIAEWIDHRVR